MEDPYALQSVIFSFPPGSSALHFAMRSAVSVHETVALLIERGADPNLVAGRGDATEYAKIAVKRDEMMEILRPYMKG